VAAARAAAAAAWAAAAAARATGARGPVSALEAAGHAAKAASEALAAGLSPQPGGRAKARRARKRAGAASGALGCGSEDCSSHSSSAEASSRTSQPASPPEELPTEGLPEGTASSDANSEGQSCTREDPVQGGRGSGAVSPSAPRHPSVTWAEEGSCTRADPVQGARGSGAVPPSAPRRPSCEASNGQPARQVAGSCRCAQEPDTVARMLVQGIVRVLQNLQKEGKGALPVDDLSEEFMAFWRVPLRPQHAGETDAVSLLQKWPHTVEVTHDGARHLVHLRRQPQCQELQSQEPLENLRAPQTEAEASKAKVQAVHDEIQRLNQEQAKFMEQINEQSGNQAEFFAQKAELHAQLDELCVKMNGLQEQKDSIYTAARVKRAEAREMRQQVNLMKQSIGYNSEQEIDVRAATIEHQLCSDTMAPREELKLLAEIQELKRIRPMVNQVHSMEEGLQSFDPGRSMKENIAAINEEMAKCRELERGVSAKLAELMESRQEQLAELMERDAAAEFAAP